MWYKEILMQKDVQLISLSMFFSGTVELGSICSCFSSIFVRGSGIKLIFVSLFKQ